MDTIEVKMLNNTLITATRLGNNAAWNCSCGKVVIGSSLYYRKHVVCPSCDAHYRIIAPGQGSKPTEIQEVKPKKR